MEYYDKFYREFAENTVNIDMTSIYLPFLDMLEVESSILDLGCGSGRDLKYFKDKGYKVIGLEPSRNLANFARHYSKCEVIKQTIQEYDSNGKLDGIWACASLLHLDTETLKMALKKISGLMHKGSAFYCSFKHGMFEGERNGRFFNDQTIESFSKILPSSLQLVKSWITKDQRPNRKDMWLNLISTKSNRDRQS